jgi:cardiolipin synthase
VEEALKKDNVGIASLQHYLRETAGFPAYTNTSVRYFKSGEEKWAAMLEEKERDIRCYLNNIREKVAEDKDQHIMDEHSSGFVIPFADCPLDGHRVGERVYMDILNRAHDYIYIMTPYLILDGDMENSIRFAAERGVDVRIILPGIPDKKAPYMLAKTHYQSLLEAGVKIYEYTPGFVHSKVFLSDDETAVVGTINLDYRSLYHHFECATYMRKTGCIGDIKADFTESLKYCRRITPETVEKEKWINKTTGVLLKIIAPLM